MMSERVQSYRRLHTDEQGKQYRWEFVLMDERNEPTRTVYVWAFTQEAAEARALNAPSQELETEKK